MQNAKIKVGFGKVEITPPLDCELTGFVARQGNSCGVHDALWARALVLSDGRQKMALVTADLIGLARETIRRIRAEAARRTDIGPQQIIICTTHTHSGPVSLEGGFLGEPDLRYIAQLVEKIAEAIVIASQTLATALTSVGRSSCSLVGKNRRIAGGRTDPDIMVLRFDYDDGRRILLANYACHPVVLGPENRLVSGDYPYYLQKTLAQVYPGCESLFLNGATGDINVGHRATDSIHNSAASKRTFAEAERLGRLLAGRVIEAVETAELIIDTKLRIAGCEVELSLEEPLPTAAEYQNLQLELAAQAKELRCAAADYGSIRQAEVWSQWAGAMRHRAEAGRLAPGLTTEVAVFALGEVEFVTFPGEFFHELGQQVKQARPGRKVFIIGYCNDAIGYVAPAAAYAQGGYEIEDSYRYYGLPARLAQGAGETVVATIGRMLQMIRHEAAAADKKNLKSVSFNQIT